ncbi:nucleoside deaminase [Cereibacter changlensis]|uniref:nucleoside deaminase n=1 Tax=Cereibacter changlensis TaxID=402884 RepID=UPI004034C0DA
MDQKAQAAAGPSADERSAMNEAIDRALRAARESGKSGIAATVLKAGKVVATGENEVHLQCDPTQHAEMVAITRAAQVLGTTDLSDCVLISTLQPCEMCLSAFRFAGMQRVIFAATQANVPEKYFAFPHLRLEDFQRNADFTSVAGLDEELVLHLYATGDE